MERIALLLLVLLLPSMPIVAISFSASNITSSISSALDIPSSLDNIIAGEWGRFKSLLNAGLGDTRDAIVPLKQYFARFGYLNITAEGENITNVFDEQALAAVKLYQESFGLEVSGRLDLQTLVKIMTPRCGREDVADGIPLMLQSIPARNRSLLHATQHYSFFPTQPRWPESRRNLTYAFSSENETQRVSAEARRQAFKNAFSEWSAVVPINFTEIESFESADITIEFASFSHGDGEPFDGVLGILAHAFSPTDGRFHLDDSEFWYSSSSSSSGGPQYIDLQSVVTHEIGHLLGLAHSSVEDAMMYPSIAPGQVKVQLQQDDIEGAQALYGVNPSYNPDAPLPGMSPTSVSDVNNSAALSALSLVSSLLSLSISFLSLLFFFDL